jgi:hypothetical protein
MTKNKMGCHYCGSSSSGTLLMIPYFKAFCDDCKGDAEKDHQEHIDKAFSAEWYEKDELRIKDFELLTLKMAIEMLDDEGLRDDLKGTNPLFLGPFALSQQIKGLLVPKLSEYMSTWEEKSPDPIVDGSYRIFKPIPLEAFIEAAKQTGMLAEDDDDDTDEMPEV